MNWYEQHNCQHAHCPNNCDKPQPFIKDGELYCGRCAYYDGVLVPMLPCTPEICNERA